MSMADLGNFALAAAVLAAMVGVLAALAAVRFESPRALSASRWLIGGIAAMLSLAVAALAVAMINCDFRIVYVSHYTEKALPLGYKLAAVWAGQEGSILLWGWLVAVMSVIFAVTKRDFEIAEGAAVYATVIIVCGFFAALLLFAANPFALNTQVPTDGRGLNPLLQDPAMIAHPPLLFLGYAGFTFPFALLVGALVAGRRDNQWLAGTRRWILVAWLFLSAGILLGAQWAYVELGWGGYWAWDPVENASLLPWLTGTALLHSIMGQQHRGMFKKWNASLIAGTFVLCIFGTYLTRSGIIQSVHAFGESLIGTFFLAFMIVIALASVVLIVVRRRELKSEQEMQGLVGREGAFVATNLILVGMTLVTLFGTLLPVISRIGGGKDVTVGSAFYNNVVGPIGMLLVALMGIGPLLTYGEGSAKRLAKGVLVPAILAIAAVLIAPVHGVWARACVGIVTLGVACIVIDLFFATLARVRDGDNALLAMLRLIDANHRRYGGQTVHFGMLLVLAGVVGSSVFQDKRDVELNPGQTVSVAGQTLNFAQLREVRKENYTAVQAELTLTAANGAVTPLLPQRRFYDKSDQPNTEVAISSSWKRDVYCSLAGWDPKTEAATISVIVNPLVSWIWTGGIVMCAGALFCMLPRIGGRSVPVANVAPVASSAAAPRGFSLGRA